MVKVRFRVTTSQECNVIEPRSTPYTILLPGNSYCINTFNTIATAVQRVTTPNKLHC